jgi:23S rRNA maturation mini-RNase III
MASGALAPHEAALLQWAGRKQHVRMRTRFSRAGAERTYRRATALEALVGARMITAGRGGLGR